MLTFTKLHALLLTFLMMLSSHVGAAAANKNLISTIDHLGLTVSKLEQSKDFFVNQLGFKKVGGDPSYPAYYLNNGQITLTLWQAHQAIAFDRKRQVGLHHLALRVATLEQLNQLHTRLQGLANVRIEFAPEYLGKGPTQHMMIREPSGNRIEFIVRVPKS